MGYTCIVISFASPNSVFVLMGDRCIGFFALVVIFLVFLNYCFFNFLFCFVFHFFSGGYLYLLLHCIALQVNFQGFLLKFFYLECSWMMFCLFLMSDTHIIFCFTDPFSRVCFRVGYPDGFLLCLSIFQSFFKRAIPISCFALPVHFLKLFQRVIRIILYFASPFFRVCFGGPYRYHFLFCKARKVIFVNYVVNFVKL